MTETKMSAVAGRYEGKVAIVTGGASGIGLACCERLVAEGAAVGVLDIDGDAAERAASAICERQGSALAFQADVANPASIASAISRAARALGRLDLAVNNAGVGGTPTLLKDLSVETWNRTIAINLSGVFHSMQAEYEHLLAAGGGAVVNIASMLGVIGYPEAGAYVAAKHGVIGLTRAAALGWGAQNIRVVAVCPTFTPTAMTNHRSSEEWDELALSHALRRLPCAEDVAATISFLGSQEARFVTGSVHMVDAGYTAG